VLAEFTTEDNPSPRAGGDWVIKVGDLISLPHGQGYTIAMKVVTHYSNPKMPTGDTAVMVIMEWGEDWWDADCCEVISESR
jgi:hypothetical protein